MYFSKIKKVTFGKNIAYKMNDFKHIKSKAEDAYKFINKDLRWQKNIKV